MQFDRTPRWLRDFVPLVFWLGLIFWLSSQPQLVQFDEPLTAMLFAKTAHFVVYGILAWLWWRALSSSRQLTWSILLTAFILTTLYGASDEIHQSYVLGRTGQFADVLVDASGALAMVLSIRRIKLKRPEEFLKPFGSI
jgi:VanZ family protein